MPIVTLPDGTEVEFPDGTPRETMEAALRDYTARTAAESPSLGGRVLDRLGTVAGRAGRFVDDVVRQAARGATLGFADEIAAGARTGAGLWGDYGSALAEERARDRDFEQRHPIAAGAAQIAGGAAVPLGTMGRAASLPGAMIRGAGTGAAVGGAAGFGEGEGGLSNRLAAAGRGAMFGGAAGAALPAVAAGVGAAGRAVGERIGLADPAAPAQRMLLRDLARDAVAPDELAARSTAAGNRPVVLPDLAGENLRETARVVARLPGEGQRRASELLRARGGEAQAERLADDVRRFVSGDDFRATTDELIARRARQAAPLYERAYAVELPRDLRLQRFLNDPDVAEGVRRGIASARREALAEDRAFDLAELGVRIGDDGIQLVRDGMPTRLFDVAKRGLDEMIEAQTDPVTRRITPQGRDLVRLRDAMVRRLDELNPAYAEARAAFSGPSRLLDAMAVGRGLFNESPDAAEWTARRIAALPPAEREAVRLGAAQALLDRIGRTTDAAEQTRLNNLFLRRDVRERLRATFDSEDEFKAFAEALRREASMAATNRAINPAAGSQTFQAAERRADLASPPPGPAMQVLMDSDRAAFGGPGASVARDVIQAGRGGGIGGAGFRLAERVDEAMRARALERNAGQMAPYLFNPDPAERQRLIEALIQRRLRDEQMQGLLGPVIPGLLRGGAAAGGLLSN